MKNRSGRARRRKRRRSSRMRTGGIGRDVGGEG